MIFWGETAGGDRFLLGEPQEAALSFDRDAPADGFKARFPVAAALEEMVRVRVFAGRRQVFAGIVDEQNTRISGDGLTLELVGRSLEALLLDNEAPPGIVTSPSLEVLEARLLTPLGLRLGEGDRASRPGEMNIEKGKSCWSVLAGFCRDFLGTTPYVEPDGTVQCAGQAEQQVELSEITEAQLRLLPVKRISQVWQQSYRGGYDTLYRGAEHGLPRRRYLALGSEKQPREVLAAGERESFRLEATCLGPVWPVRGAAVSIALPGIGQFERCPVESAQYRRDRQGERTRLTLGPPEKSVQAGG